jgi:hypothetical protein
VNEKKLFLPVDAAYTAGRPSTTLTQTQWSSWPPRSFIDRSPMFAVPPCSNSDPVPEETLQLWNHLARRSAPDATFRRAC